MTTREQAPNGRASTPVRIPEILPNREESRLDMLNHRSSMKLEIDPDALRPVIEMVVQKVLAETAPLAGTVGSRLGYTEAEAAALLGVERHVLRDARQRGELEASKVGRRIIYTPNQLREYLANSRWEPK